MIYEDNFLPKDMIPENPKYFVWYTGTLGQAEWLITYSKKLYGKSIPKECKSNLSNVPQVLLPLLTLEQPDLIVTDNENNPLISIEITEQQSFGTNSQQRMARFWSAVANNVPSAYIYPIESYQIEKCENINKVRNILSESDNKKQEFILFSETLLRVNGKKTYENGITSIDKLKSKIRCGDITLIAGVTQKNIKQLQTFLDKFVDKNRKSIHLDNIPPREYYHKVGNTYYKAYIRKPEICESMLLEWFKLCSEVVPSYPFMLTSELKFLFRTNGLIHILDNVEKPYLAYRNLPPIPNSSDKIQDFEDNKKDEMGLFFDYVDDCIENKRTKTFLREKIMCPGEYWDQNIREKWVTKINEFWDIDTKESGDFVIDKKEFLSFLNENQAIIKDFTESIKNIDDVHIYKIFNTAPKRGLYDPYSGTLAVRDILFTRNRNNLKELYKFDRNKLLILFVDFKGKSATDHKFLESHINNLFSKKRPNADGNLSVQDKLIWLLKNLYFYEFSKDIRCHILFSDLIVVRRKFSDGSFKFEFIYGVPSLLRLKLINLQDKSLKSLIL